ncbi:hypothetical protein N657DRAFT_628732 [Parathielavia appendiculata]|uniref:Uncharacterized protein n=1 Tax=Parathielavia appendiculata TaxID=2587402 RepID=A0AAN6TPJ7_9PEZI|nr:hypothetical protein N657DRAFT_628732 [Parathielavia appendiculata]
MDSNIAMLQAENEALPAQLEAMKPRKRKRVNTDPNLVSANIGAIRTAQIEAGAVETEQVDTSEDGESSDTASCIVVAAKSRKSGI